MSVQRHVVTSTRSRPLAVAFDLMDTVVHDPFRQALEAATGLPIDVLFARRDKALYPAFERGEISEDDYWRGHEALGIAVDERRFHVVRRARTRFIAGMDLLLDELEGRVLRIAASNYPVWIDELAAGMLAGRFEVVLASHHLGVRKPEPAFFHRVVAEVGLDASRIAFVDDRQANVEAAAAVGMPAHHFTTASRLRRWLGGLDLDVTG